MHIRRLVTSNNKIAKFEETTSSDLFWVMGGNETVVEVEQSLAKVPIDGLSNHCWKEPEK